MIFPSTVQGQMVVAITLMLFFLNIFDIHSFYFARVDSPF